MKIEIADNRTDSFVETLVTLWEASVRATHDFLEEADIDRIKPQARQGLQEIALLLYAVSDDGRICGFMGVQDKMIEMLFIDPAHRGNGLGRRFINEAVSRFSAEFVDVNEQNRQGVGFYEHVGFTLRGRSEEDAQGNPFPILHMEMTS